MECPDCKGEGKVLRKPYTLAGVKYPETKVNCFRCDGTGGLCDGCGESDAICDGGCQDSEG